MSSEEQASTPPLVFDVGKQKDSNLQIVENVVKKVMVKQVVTEGTGKNLIVECIPSIDNKNRLTPSIQDLDVSASTSSDTADNDNETFENGMSNEEQDAGTPKHSRELKLLLALSKEANLDTNIAYKRKSVEPPGRTETTSKRRYSTGSNGDYVMSQANQLDESQCSHLNSEFDENLTDDFIVDNKELNIKEGKKIIEGAVDENGVRDRKMCNSFITINEEKKDSFCWQCHHSRPNFFCKSCPRSFHQKCLRQGVAQPNHWLCPECVTIMQAENLKQRSSAMRNMTLVHLCVLLKFALKRMLQVGGCEPFIHPVNDEEFPEYKKYIICPMDITRLEKNIKKNLYGSPQAFEADAKWILHNSIIFNTYQSKLTSVAKSMLKICKQEMIEIENCATCYLNANTKKKTWFVEVCPKPHIVVWAKLKGFPYWPAKAMKCNASGMVDVRFFGAHDRAWVQYKECFLFSVKDPNSNKQKKNDIIESVKELQLYVENLKKVYGEFRYADYRVQLEPDNLEGQLKQMLPNYPNACRTRKSIYKIQKSNGTDLVGEELQKENDVGELNISKPIKSDESSDEDNVSLELYRKKNFDESIQDHNKPEENSSPLARSGNVRMRGGIRNTSGKIKIFHKTPERSNKRLSTEEIKTPNKVPRISSNSNDDTLSNSTEALSEYDAYDTSKTSVGSHSDSEQKPTASPEIQVSHKKDEDSEILVPLKTVPKISDRIMKKISESEKSINAPVKDDIQNSTSAKEVTEPNSFLDKFSTKGLTVLEKITELSADTEIFETDKVVKNKIENDITKQEECDDFICTEVDLEEKNNLLLNSDVDTNDVTISSNVISESDGNIDNNSCTSGSETGQLQIDVSEQSNTLPDITGREERSLTPQLMEKLQEKEVENNDGTHDHLSPSPQSKLDTHAKVLLLNPGKSSKKSLSVPALNIGNEGEMDKDVKSKNDNVAPDIATLQKHMLTLVCVDDIKKKNLDSVSSTTSTSTKSILQDRLCAKSDKDSACVSDNEAVAIKSEPSSEDEPSDSEYLEKKRMYLSALNISEKLPEKPKPNEIRTRSKTEERTFRVVDNLSKVIDDVATHYSINHANDEITISKTPKRKEIFIKPLSSLQDLKQRARKSFPSSKNISVPKNETVKVCKSVSTPVFSVKSTPQKLTLLNKSPDITNTTKVILTPASVNSTVNVLPPNQPIAYTSTALTPLLTMIQTPCSSGLILPPLSLSYAKTPESHNPTTALATITTISNTAVSSNTSNAPTIGTTAVISSILTTNNDHVTQTNAFMEETRVIASSVPENVSKAINDIMYGTPPKLKPRPPGPLNVHFNEGVPSTAGSVTSKINSISHRLNDYFRGMLIELLREVGTVANPEAVITQLKLENEELKHRHSEEILEIKKNIGTILKDMQKSLTDEKERAIEETRAACELETLKRVEDAKSKQWCACCAKEAQFYCCWNTSYCDYPCQQKHWSVHMSKCTQQIQSSQLQNSGIASTTKTSIPQPLVLRPTAAPKGLKAKTLISKSTKVLVNRPTSVNKVPFTFARTTGNHITLVESTPGNYELLGTGGPISVGGKIITNFGKKITGSVLTVTSTANSNLDLATLTPKKITLNPAQALPATNKVSNSNPEVID